MTVPASGLPRRNLARLLFAVVCAMLVAYAACEFPATLASAPQTAVHASSRKDRAAGAAIFHEKGCEHCHGVEAVGTDLGPNLTTVGKRLRKNRIERQIREGGGNMPAFGDALTQDEVKALVAYLSAKKKPKSLSLNR